MEKSSIATISINLFGSNEKTALFLKQALSQNFRTPVEIIHSLIQDIKNLQDSILIVDQSKTQTPEELNFLLSLKTKMTILLDSESFIPELVTFAPGWKLEDLMDKIQKIMPQEFIKAPTTYVSMSLNLLSQFKTSPCDIYLRIGKSVKDFKYIKRIHLGHTLEMSDLQNYENKGISCLYIDWESQNLFLSKLKDMVLTMEPKENIKGIINITSEIQDIVKTLIKDTLIEQETIDLANTSIKAMANTISLAKTPLALLRALLTNKTSFNYKHSYLIMIFSYEILKRSDFVKTSSFKNVHEMMAFVAFYHDIYLPTDEMAMIKNQKEFYLAPLNKKEKEIVKHHAKLSADLLSQYKGTPLEAAKIIKAHHGTTNGIGFSNTYSASLPYLAMIFIVVEFFIFKLIFPVDNKGDVQQVFALCEEEFTLPSYRKIFELLKSVFKKV